MSLIDAERHERVGAFSETPPWILSDEELPGYEATLTRKSDLTDHLVWQLRLSHFSEEEERVAMLIIGNLDADGYFKMPALDGDGEDASMRDPLVRCMAAFRARGVPADLDALEAAIVAEIDAAVEFAKSSPFPDQGELPRHLFAGPAA